MSLSSGLKKVEKVCTRNRHRIEIIGYVLYAVKYEILNSMIHLISFNLTYLTIYYDILLFKIFIRVFNFIILIFERIESYGVFFSTKKCALYFNRCNFMFVS